MGKWLAGRQWSAALVACLALALLVAGTSTLLGTTIAQAAQICEGTNMTQPHRTTLPGHLIPVLHNLAPLHDLDCNQTLQLTIRLRERNADELNQFMATVNDPHSSNYHHYLTPTEFADRFGQPPEVVAQVVAFLQSAGFTVTDVATNRLAITVTATVARIAATFGVHLANFQFGPRVVFAPLDEPSVPPQFGAVIQNIIGLSDVAQAFRPR